MKITWQSRKPISSLSTPAMKFPSPEKLHLLLQLCSKSKALDQGRQTHQRLILQGLDQDPFMATKLVQMYADCGDSKSAHLLFDKMSQPNVFAWTSILSVYSRRGMSGECIGFYCEMKLKGVVPDRYVFPKVLRACAQSGNFKVGIQVHKDVVTCGDELNVQVCNSLIDMYSKCGDTEGARRVFSEMAERDLLSWNSMISGYVCNGFLESALDLLGSMRLEGFEPDLVTWNMAIDVYCRMGQCDEAWNIFEQIEEPNIISWTTLISGYSRIGKHEVTLAIFRDMVRKGEGFPDLDCISSIIVSCRHLGALTRGREIHGYGIKMETECAFYKSAGPALLTMYARCRKVRDATNVFNLMDNSDVVTWNAMILTCADLGTNKSALNCFRKMQSMGIKNDQTTISTVLPVCDLEFGTQLHAYISKNGFSNSIPICNALIHMYSKGGCIETAYSVFSKMVSGDLVSWNTMIGGFGMHGFGQATIQLLIEMNKTGICPNSATFTSVLSACSHSGLVDKGLEVFHRMKKDFGCDPKMEHFSCIVDLLARAGRLEDAVGFIAKMPLEPDKSIWGAVLSASQAQQDIKFAILASVHLVHLEPEYAGHYVTLANIYATAGRWEDAVRVRKLMEGRGLVKTTGNSWIDGGK
ncbi:hypothetical protein RHGRI_017797 [Rhododendron griersonianum]|uniref:Pentatricopeptide repeat-containing protein n=1 Tax=Rhododendron griersonianum TaxID=479676 RepID=A0AAV6JZ34_9ERIC|nr:hypothetical protein RHGRI_017797 [Rhododendron griersonianum]